MSVRFFEGRTVPSGLRESSAMGRYGDGTFTEAGAVNIMNAVSPWNFLTSWLVTKPAQAEAAQVELAQLSAQAAAAQSMAQAKTTKTLILAGAGLIGVLVLVVALKPRKTAVAGYRRRRRR